MWKWRNSVNGLPSMKRQFSSSSDTSFGGATRAPPIISIQNATFYRQHPNISANTSASLPLFQDLSFELPSFAEEEKHWAIIGPSSAGKTTLLQILRGNHICIPPAARSWPYLETKKIQQKDDRLRNPNYAIKLVGFDGEQGLGTRAPQSAYLSARYESRREDTDFSLLDYLQGNTELNLVNEDNVDPEHLKKVVEDLRLTDLLSMPVGNLSNGQTRRSRIARALLRKPEVLLLDEPFMGLDPMTVNSLSTMLHGLAKERNPRLVLSLRPQDEVPKWITVCIVLKGSCEIAHQGRLATSRDRHNGTFEEISLENDGKSLASTTEQNSNSTISEQFGCNTDLLGFEPHSKDGYLRQERGIPIVGKPLIEMEGVKIHYSKANRTLFADSRGPAGQEGLWWTIKRGQRWGIFGPNGSGKTTLLSLICSDHPQTYSLPIRLFGRSRLPEPGRPGISIFDLQSRIGHSSPEIHNHIPRSLTLRQVLENAWADTFRSVPKLSGQAPLLIDTVLRWFGRDLSPYFFQQRPALLRYIEQTGTDYGCDEVSEDHDQIHDTIWADKLIFGELPFSAQRVALFLRAIIKSPDLVILDEAFSGMDDEVRDRCLLFLAHGEMKRFAYDVSLELNGLDGATSDNQGKIWRLNSRSKRITDGQVSRCGNDTSLLKGLNEEQALLCISHVREEIPGSIREWICLSETGTGRPARFGRLDGPLEGNEKRWKEIWGMV